MNMLLVQVKIAYNSFIKKVKKIYNLMTSIILKNSISKLYNIFKNNIILVNIHFNVVNILDYFLIKIL